MRRGGEIQILNNLRNLRTWSHTHSENKAIITFVSISNNSNIIINIIVIKL